MPYFTKDEATGEFVEVADDALLSQLDVKKHPDYIKADNRVKELNKENEKRRKQLEAALKQDDGDSETPEPVVADKPAAAKPVEIDLDAITAQIEAKVIQKIAQATESSRSHDTALDALLSKHNLPDTLKPALVAAGNIDAATKLAQTLGEAKLQFPQSKGGNGNAKYGGVITDEALKKIARDLNGFKD